MNGKCQQYDKAFHKLDEKMDKLLLKYEKVETSKKFVNNDFANSLMLSANIKRKCIVSFIAKKRREYILNQDAEFAMSVNKMNQYKFTVKDAVEMISLENTKDYALHRHDIMSGSLITLRSKMKKPFRLYMPAGVDNTGTSTSTDNRPNVAVETNLLTTSSLSTVTLTPRHESISSFKTLTQGPSIEEQIKALVIQLHKQNDTFNKYHKTLYANFDVVPRRVLLQPL